MPANYKYKRLKEQQSLDKKSNEIRKNLNSSERIRLKKQIKKTLNERTNIVEELRWELEVRQSVECHQNQLHGPHVCIQDMLAVLDIGNFDLYKCTCTNYDKYSDEEILKMFGL